MYAELPTDVTDQVLNGLFIPPCPATLTAIMQEARHPETNLQKVAQLINQDAGMVAPLLKLANSPLVGLRTKVTSVLQATNILGMKNTLNLVRNIALRQSLKGNGQSFDKFWERSTLTAAVAEKLTAALPGISADDAYVAALFHDCGIPVLMHKFSDYRKTVMAGNKAGIPLIETENMHLQTNHAVVGNILTRIWGLPAPVYQAILYHHDATIFQSPKDPGRKAVCDLAGLIHMAECVVDEHLNVMEKEWPAIAATVLGHFELDEQEFNELKSDMLAYLGSE
ncbi:MAG: HDOD domain-containing protein [Nitrosomonadales bacterium]|nr:HDOD domain-containing protein [Nitrosomonadales bacterium]